MRACSGPLVNISTLVIWMCTNLHRRLRQTVGMGLLTDFCNCGASVSGTVSITQDSPGNSVGFDVNLALSCVCLITAMFCSNSLWAGNRHRDKQQCQRADAYLPWTMQDRDVGVAEPEFRFSCDRFFAFHSSQFKFIVLMRIFLAWLAESVVWKVFVRQSRLRILKAIFHG